MKKEELLEKTTYQYLKSGDFNGLALSGLKSEKENIIALVREGTIEINFGDKHRNPHIKAFELDDKDLQILKIESIGLENACAYPTRKHLERVVDINKFKDRPFTLKIALGEPQLNYAVFDLSVLEAYRNDPRYIYSSDDIQGWISVSDEYYPSSSMKASDKVLLQSFGFCYEKGTWNRAVAVFYRYLAYLTPEHQQIWNSKVLTGEYFLHPDYARSSAGNFYERESIFVAFCEELHTINEFSRLMDRPSLFRESYRVNRPREFAYLIRPTLKEYNSFVLLLDKMISDNINKDFFQRDVTCLTETKTSDGKVMVRPKATISLLKDWLDIKFRTPDPRPKDEMIETFRKIRRMRMKPAHRVDEDRFEPEYLKEQRKLMIEAYSAIRMLRLILQNHPRTRTYVIPDWLFKGEIWNF
ncbi:MAG: AAA family ATPase [Candidatus Atabeyarchaeum deiterrae]